MRVRSVLEALFELGRLAWVEGKEEAEPDARADVLPDGFIPAMHLRAGGDTVHLPSHHLRD
eukprot:444501-Lingulodinium_polyedra.AAC.1